MEAWPLIILLVLGIPILALIWIIVRAVDAKNRIEELSRRVQDLEIEFARARKQAPRAPESQAASLLAAAAPPPIQPEPKVVEPSVPEPSILSNLPPLSPITAA